MNGVTKSAFARLMGADRAIRESPNIIDARALFSKRADAVRLSRQYRNPKGQE